MNARFGAAVCVVVALALPIAAQSKKPSTQKVDEAYTETIRQNL